MYNSPLPPQFIDSKSTMSHVNLVVVIFGILFLKTAECRSIPSGVGVTHSAISCRKHFGNLIDYGGFGEGNITNTKAFRDAVAHLSQYADDGGALLYVPPGRWLTGSFNLTSHFTLFLDKDAVILAAQDETEFPRVAPLPSYGEGRDGGGRFGSLIFGTNLTDVVITGNNGTIDGQGAFWWDKFHKGVLNATRPYLVEIMYSNQIQISNLTFTNSPSWHIHPIYSSNITIQGLTILAPVAEPNTDGINPDSCSQVRIEDCYIVSGDDCIAVKSGWDQYGYKFGMPAEHHIIRRLTCISPKSATVALGSEMSGGIRNVRIEDVTSINTESSVRVKTAVGRGGYVKDIFVRRMTLKTMKYVFWVTGGYGSHPSEGFDPKALPDIQNINYRDIVAENVTQSARMDGIANDPFKGFCFSNVSIALSAKPKELQWNCTAIQGITSNVTPKACALFPEQPKPVVCAFPEDKLAIEGVQMKTCTA